MHCSPVGQFSSVQFSYVAVYALLVSVLVLQHVCTSRGQRSSRMRVNHSRRREFFSCFVLCFPSVVDGWSTNISLYPSQTVCSVFHWVRRKTIYRSDSLNNAPSPCNPLKLLYPRTYFTKANTITCIWNDGKIIMLYEEIYYFCGAETKRRIDE